MRMDEQTALGRWCCLAPNVFCASSLVCCFAWMLLHAVVPSVAANLLNDSPRSSFKSPWIVRASIRCMLSIFPPPAPAVEYQGKPGRASADTYSKTNETAPSSTTKASWRRARAASYLLVSGVSLQRIVEKRAEGSSSKLFSWKSILAMPIDWIHSEFIVSELLISLASPLAIARASCDSGSDIDAERGGVFERFSSPETFLLILIAHRIVGPISIAVRAVSEEMVERMNQEMHGGGEALVGENHILPQLATTMLWIVWALVLANLLGIPVGQLVQSLGITGLVIAAALQHYAADAVGSLTLLADKRFSTGDLVRIGSETSSLYIIDKVGILSTSVHSFIGPRAKTYFPNSFIVRAQIINESRQKNRRVNLRAFVDPRPRAKSQSPSRRRCQP